MRYLPVLITAILLFSASAICQTFPMLHYGVENGLPGNKIYSIYKDSKGYTWISTDKGIARYNGIKFEVFSTFNGLPDNEIFYFQEDHSERLWMGTYNGELCYYKNDTFHTVANTTFLRNKFRPRSYIKSIVVEDDSTITFYFNGEANFINIKDERSTIVYADSILYSNTSRYRNSNFIYGKKTGRNEYDLFFREYSVRIDTTAHILSLHDERPSSAYYLPNNDQRYIIDGHSFYSLQRPRDTIKIRTLTNDSSMLTCPYFDGSEYFVLTSKGVYYDSGHILLNGLPSAFGQDNKGNYWVGTLDEGIYVLDKHFKDTKFFKDVYRGNVKFSYCTGGKVYFSSRYSLYSLTDNKIREILRYKHHYDADPALLINEKHTLYYFCGSTGITIRNLNDHNKRELYADAPESSYKRLIWLKGRLYAQLMTDIVVINTDQKNRQSRITAGNRRIYCMAKDHDEAVWYSTRENLYKISGNGTNVEAPVKLGFKFFDFVRNRLIGVLHNNVFLLCSDVNGAFAVDTIPTQDCIWEKFYKLDDTHVLISTNKRYRLLTVYAGAAARKYEIRTLEDPFIPLQAESFCSDSNNCYFFKGGSITNIRISSLFSRPIPPELHFKFLQSAGRSYFINDKVSVPFSESRNMSISFSTLSFSGDRISYQYSVSANDDDNWRDLPGEKINLDNTGYGVYTIKIRAKTLSGSFSAPIAFALEVARPFWATWWFIFIAVVCIVALAAAGGRQIVIHFIRKKEQEHNVRMRFVKSEYKALNALMNPHFIFNTLNNLQSLFNTNDKRLANKYLRVFANLIRQNMHNIAQEEISLQREIDLVANYLQLEKMRFEDKLQYRIDVPGDLDISVIMIPPLLIQPLVENSIKHGILQLDDNEGIILLNIFERGDELVIQVRDNGPGIGTKPVTPDEGWSQNLHESFGLDNIRKRIEQLGIIQNKKISLTIGDIICGDTQARLWTVVTITIPLS